MGFGKNAAFRTDERLMGHDRFAALYRPVVYDQTVPETPSEVRRHHTHELPPSERVGGVREVALGLTDSEAMEEACRCLRCDVRS
jgi:hypothetical protein